MGSDPDDCGRCGPDRWSPDGQSILFSAHNATVLVNVKSGRQRVLDPGSGGPLSPDRRLIALDRDETIWIMNADGSNKHRLTTVSILSGRRPYRACLPAMEQPPGWAERRQHLHHPRQRDGGATRRGEGVGRLSVVGTLTEASRSSAIARRAAWFEPARLQLALLDPQVARVFRIVASARNDPVTLLAEIVTVSLGSAWHCGNETQSLTLRARYLATSRGRHRVHSLLGARAALGLKRIHRGSHALCRWCRPRPPLCPGGSA